MGLSPEVLDRLVEAAARAREAAHAPYSGFRVGAAVLADDGRVFAGCNVEVSSYSHSCCAERVAAFKAISEGARALAACAVVTDADPAVAPCGACRQVLADFGRDLVVVLVGAAGGRECVPLADLLPRAFRPEDVLGRLGERWGRGGDREG